MTQAQSTLQVDQLFLTGGISCARELSQLTDPQSKHKTWNLEEIRPLTVFEFSTKDRLIA